MNIKVNGKLVQTNHTNISSLKLQYPNHDVVIYNGFQTSQNHALHENDEVTFIKKGVFPTHTELESMLSSRHTPGVYKKIKQAKVAIAGLGGLGSNIAISLARTGVGKLLLIDFDTVEPSNLNRQHYSMTHLGMYKTDALKSQITNINPYVQVLTHTVYLDETNAVTLFKGYPIICEAFDDPTAKSMLADTVLTQLPHAKLISASGMAGYESSNTIKTTKVFENLYICGDGTSEAEPGNGLMSPRVQICAGHQANMVLRLILGINNV